MSGIVVASDADDYFLATAPSWDEDIAKLRVVDDYADDTSTSGSGTVNSAAVGGNIEEFGDSDWFRVTLSAGQNYIFRLQGADSGVGTLADTYLYLRNAAGVALAQDDDSGQGLDSQIEFHATQSGTYYLDARAFDDVYTGTYIVTATRDAGPTPGPDFLIGDDSSEFISALGGNDSVDGLGGDDTIYGGAGNDTLTGADGDDTVSGDAGNDRVISGANDDRLYGGIGNGTIGGTVGNDTVDGGAGNDILWGGGATDPGIDRIYGGDGNDYASGDSGSDTLYGGGGGDSLFGKDGADTIFGGVGNDTIAGGGSADAMTGGTGRDFFVYDDGETGLGAGRDRILDFKIGEQDRIDLELVDANVNVGGDQDFTWRGSATLNGAAQLGYYVSGGITIIRGSIDGDAASEFEIQLTAGLAPTAAWFDL